MEFSTRNWKIQDSRFNLVAHQGSLIFLVTKRQIKYHRIIISRITIIYILMCAYYFIGYFIFPFFLFTIGPESEMETITESETE